MRDHRSVPSISSNTSSDLRGLVLSANYSVAYSECTPGTLTSGLIPGGVPCQPANPRAGRKARVGPPTDPDGQPSGSVCPNRIRSETLCCCVPGFAALSSHPSGNALAGTSGTHAVLRCQASRTLVSRMNASSRPCHRQAPDAAPVGGYIKVTGRRHVCGNSPKSCARNVY